MFETVRNAFKVGDIRKRIFYTFLMLIVIRIGSQIPIIGVKQGVFADWFSKDGNQAMQFFDAVTGGSFERMSIFALNITPYITSSIIMQLLTIAIPKLEEIQRDGEDGRKKIAELTRYVTIGFALMESIAMAIGFGRSGYLVKFDAITVIQIVLTLTAGSAVLMWIGERITENGIGNGISIVLIINIISRIPSDIATLLEQFVTGKIVAVAIVSALIIFAIIVVTVAFVVFLQGGERRIPVQYSQKIQGRRQVGGQSSFIPLKVNTAGVIPVIFAQSLMQVPVVISMFLGKSEGTGVWSEIVRGLSQGNWFNPDAPIYTIGAVLYIVLIIGFAYFYTSITFNPLEIANNMKRQGGFIPGIRPGKSTSDYLNKILNYIIFIGAVGLTIVTIFPLIFNGVYKAQVSFGGTSIIIIAGVVIETIKQIESQMLVRNYKGFLNN